ncbi:MAG TPA: hypothetical protein VK864_20775 [Longimicrobiales bacterium]|nr:hypothetical protein [Longimicrobiales bacterium]
MAAERPAEFSTLFPAAAAAAAGGALLGYELGLHWRFLGSTPERAREREAVLGALLVGGTASALGACLRTDDPDIGAKECLDGAVIGLVPATVIAAAVSWKLPGWLQPVAAIIVFGVLEGGVTAWIASQ